MSAPRAKLTFTPGVEEHDDVLATDVSGRGLAPEGAAGHRQRVAAAHGAGGRLDGQLQRVAALLHDLGPPALVRQRVHQQNGGVGSLGDGGQRTCSTGMVSTRMRKVNHRILHMLNTTDC